MKPFKRCPVCQVPVRWVLHDGGNDYDCSNKDCPICFSEYVWFKKNETNFDLENGLLFHYRFKLDKYNVSVHYKEFNEEVASFIRINLIADAEKRVYLPPFSIDWHNLELLKQKIKTLLIFS